MTTIKLFVSISFFFLSCANGSISTQPATHTPDTPKEIVVGAEQMDLYLPLLQGKSVGLVANQSATYKEHHLLDALLEHGVHVQTIFSPEHGFRGKASAGAEVKDGKDPISGLPVISLYGKNRKPSAKQLEGIDVVLFDIQDVGARFYTYISTLHYVLEACAENKIQVIVLDRPNPNGHYVDGPILDTAYHSFVGMHPIPIVHGMTIGEYGQMTNGEGWLKNKVKADLTVIPCKNYTHNTPYSLPIPPSPNLPNDRSILLYPSLCLLEGTVVSIGRGTNQQFQIYGHPDFAEGSYHFTPKPMPGAKYPKLDGKACSGFSLANVDPADIRQEKQLQLKYLLQAYRLSKNKDSFFLENLYFDKLAGSAVLRKQIIDGWSEEKIRASWADGLNNFRKIREKYLLYK